ncbi:BrnA antitoxin family protein [Sphingobium baderi]|uniref:Cytoplasmic protein n=1 Tax=Sphingobium baderi TaxID=1332080 RepID=A0A0S3EUM5_9SPHN|nr:BrnA antitoxin family protein [Sphingobium baderi]ALR19128.1 cytoplasmic protein [Sphingobium baderi]
MKKKDADTVRFQLDPADLPPLTDAQKAELDALQALPDSEIDYSDVPALSDDFWKGAERGRFYKPIKQQVTARLDADVLAWLKSQGKGYQARMNAILRREMLATVERRKSA